MAKQYTFTKLSKDVFKTVVDVKGKRYPVEVQKVAQRRWVAKSDFATSAGDTKRFAVHHLEMQMKRLL